MPDAPAVPAVAPVPKATDDPRFQRAPTVRQAMILLIPNPGHAPHRIQVTETASGGRLSIEVGGIERDIAMNVRELRELAAHCNQIARRAANRPEYRP